MSKKYNDNSLDITEWTLKKLKQEYRQTDNIVNGQCACYGKHDLFYLSKLIIELDNRGKTIISTSKIV